LEINNEGSLTYILFDEDANLVDKIQIFELKELSALLEETSYE